MKNSIAQKCKDYLEPIIASLGYELVDVDWEKKAHTGDNLTVFIDKPKDFVKPEAVEYEEDMNPQLITLADCEYVHKIIDEKLDELDPTNGAAYTLNVSSCGLDWAFRSDKDYQKNIGEMVDVNLFAPIERKKNYTGTLVSFDAESVVIKTTKQLVLPRTSIAKICKHIEF